MKYLVFIPTIILFYSCSTLKSDASKTTRNTHDVGIEWEYSSRIHEAYQEDMDSVINTEIQKFNSSGHSFNLHKKNRKDKDYISLEFKDGRIASKGEKIAGYIVCGLGLIATPVALIALHTGFFAAFYYLPENRYLMKCTYSDDLADPSSHGKKFEGTTGALIANKHKQVNKLYTKFSASLETILAKLDKELSSH
ncbi:hypothetical protein FW778_19990 [Ginsengibacter hankyongi]|uniref:Lipoprotein n=1 Tax=Ginsengibacter hankyongi TaxID=2607284 RepID=A0A5J5IAS5_9BACT|nr:hypothetical protein [Ginsengibacter hankyongi]KAA9035838.1 hypothetical protein FW778_19990 [Ginsengibacter hankyongi]